MTSQGHSTHSFSQAFRLCTNVSSIQPVLDMLKLPVSLDPTALDFTPHNLSEGQSLEQCVREKLGDAFFKKAMSIYGLVKVNCYDDKARNVVYQSAMSWASTYLKRLSNGRVPQYSEDTIGTLALLWSCWTCLEWNVLFNTDINQAYLLSKSTRQCLQGAAAHQVPLQEISTYLPVYQDEHLPSADRTSCDLFWSPSARTRLYFKPDCFLWNGQNPHHATMLKEWEGGAEHDPHLLWLMTEKERRLDRNLKDFFAHYNIGACLWHNGDTWVMIAVDEEAITKTQVERPLSDIRSTHPRNQTPSWSPSPE